MALITKKLYLVPVIVLIFCFGFAQRAYAAETTIESVADMFGLEEIDSELSDIAEDYGADNFSIKDIVLDMLAGNGAYGIKDLLKTIVRTALGSVSDVLYSMRKIIIIIILSALLEILCESFTSSSVSKIGQYVCSSVLIVTIMQSFAQAASTSEKAVKNITSVTETLQPLYMLIMTATGRAAKMTAAVPVLYASSSILTYGAKNVIIPGVLMAALITFINSLSEKDILMQFAELISSLCKWGVKIYAGIFVFLMSVIKIGTPSTALIAGKSIKTAAEAVPVVGSLMASAAETAAMLTYATGNAVTAAIMIFIAVISIAPVIRLAAIMLIYKAVAALTEPIASKRIVKCLNSAADYTGILMGLVFSAEIMFIIITALMLMV